MLMIALVAGSDDTYAEAKRQIRALHLVPQASIAFFRVDHIPRAGLGKPARDVLAQRARQAINLA
jgi:hypothetical protein